MENSVEHVRAIFQRDLDPDFIETFAVELGWQYDALFDEIAAEDDIDPALRDEDIVPGQVGYRPKLSGPDEPAADFLLWHDRGYLHLGGIESPGLTSSIAIAREVDAMLR